MASVISLPSSPSEESSASLSVQGSIDDIVENVSRENDDAKDEEIPYAMDLIRSKVNAREIAKYREAYKIPSDILLRIPKDHELPSSPPDGEVAISLRFFSCGLRLPIQKPVALMLRALGLAPCQLNPNFWRQLIGVLALCKEHGLPELTLEDFQCIFQTKPHPGRTKKGWHYCSAYCDKGEGRGSLIVLKPTSCQNWKGRWCFVSGNWDAEPGLTPTRFSSVGASWTKPRGNRIANSLASRLYAIPPSKRQFDDLVDPNLLYAVGLSASVCLDPMGTATKGKPEHEYLDVDEKELDNTRLAREARLARKRKTSCNIPRVAESTIHMNPPSRHINFDNGGELERPSLEPNKKMRMSDVSVAMPGVFASVIPAIGSFSMAMNNAPAMLDLPSKENYVYKQNRQFMVGINKEEAARLDNVPTRVKVEDAIDWSSKLTFSLYKIQEDLSRFRSGKRRVISKLNASNARVNELESALAETKRELAASKASLEVLQEEKACLTTKNAELMRAVEKAKADEMHAITALIKFKESDEYQKALSKARRQGAIDLRLDVDEHFPGAVDWNLLKSKIENAEVYKEDREKGGAGAA
ncbi:hypothetical protein Sjap_001278 [Stephania japonica]|uniref:Transposase (putative) gypsy type domain-containing protein n=1 Tax=Stephania japonica TaxID=461633 RepID=A0AAP0KL62_9MAGN